MKNFECLFIYYIYNLISSQQTPSIPALIPVIIPVTIAATLAATHKQKKPPHCWGGL